MSIVLGSLVLPRGVFWEDRNAYAPVMQTVLRVLGGKAKVYTGSMTGATPITLATLEDQGWYTYAQCNAVQEMANTPGAVFSLVIEGRTYSVVFRHDEPPAVDLRPLIPRSTPLESDYFSGTVKLLTV